MNEKCAYFFEICRYIFVGGIMYYIKFETVLSREVVNIFKENDFKIFKNQLFEIFIKSKSSFHI